MNIKSALPLFVVVTGALVCHASVAADHGRYGPPNGEVLDNRYNHGRFYPPVGAVRPALPASIVLTFMDPTGSTSAAAYGMRRKGQGL